jgi:Flp pilus assembly pilin Flp
MIMVLYRRIKTILQKRRDERGQGMLEYGLGIILVAMVTIGTVAMLGDNLSGTYCGITETMSSEPNDACYEEAVQEGSGPVVFKPKYNSFNNGFTITAKMIGECTGPLTVQGYGDMSQNGSSGSWALTIMGDPPSTVVVGSSDCGWTTVYLS